MKGLRSRRGRRDIAPPPARADAPAGPGDVILYTPWAAPSDRGRPSEAEARAEGARAAAEILRRQRGEAGNE